MKVQIVPKFQSSLTPRKVHTNSYYQPICPMPDMTQGDPVDITVQLVDDVSDYAPDITVITPDRPPMEMDIISTYSSQLIKTNHSNKYQIPKTKGNASWITNPIRCKECNLPGSPGMFNSDGYCLYCVEGLNGHKVP